MTEFDRLLVWSDPATRRRLGWYRAVAANRRPAKFRIAANGDGQEPNALARGFRKDTFVSAYAVELAAAQRRRSGRNVP
jgi:hypothetical protein